MIINIVEKFVTVMKLNRITIVYFIIGILFFYFNSIYSQEYLVHTYTENDGLANSKVMGVAQDSSGRMWFATRSGISVYDGSNWKSYTTTDGLTEVSYSKIKIDEKGVIWILPEISASNISYFSNNKWQTLPDIHVTEEGVRTSFFDISYAKNKRIVAAGTKNFGLFIYSDDKWIQKSVSNGLLSNTINGVVCWGEKILVATNGGLSIIENGIVDNSLNEELPFPSSYIVGIAIENKNVETFDALKVWVISKTWFGYFMNNKFTLVSDKIKTKVDQWDHFVTMLPDKRGGVYFGHPMYLYHYDNLSKKVKFLGMKNGLLSEGTTSLLVDREENLWIASLRGVSKISNMRFANYSESHGLLENEVTAIVEYEPGNFVFGHNIGLTFFNDNKIETLEFPFRDFISPSQARVLDMAIDSKKNIWVAANHLGVARVDKNRSVKWFGRAEGVIGSATSVLVDNTGAIFAATDNNIYKFDGESFKLFTDKNHILFSTRKLFHGPDDSIFLATTSKGVFQLDGKLLRQVCYSNSNRNVNNIYSILFDSQNRLLVGSRGGLMIVEGDLLTRFYLGKKKIKRPIYVIVEDRQKRLWFGTDNGVVRWDGENYEEFTVKHGFVGRETNRSAGLVDSQGRVWLGADQGVSCYDESFEKNKESIPLPIVEIVSLEVRGKPVDLSSPIHLNYMENDLDFSFRGISFIDENLVNLQYQLDGFDKDWITDYKTSFNHSRYANLAPGSYKLKLRAQNALGRWSNIKFSQNIIIKNPFWKTWWFLLLGILFSGLMISIPALVINQKRYAAKLQRQVFERTAQLKESEEKIKISLEEKVVLLKEIHHRVKNNLQLVSSLLYLQSRNLKDEQVLKIFHESQNRIRSMAMIHEKLYKSTSLAKIDFSEYIRGLTNYLYRSYSTNINDIKLRINVQNILLNIESAIPCGLILNELISNAMKYAFPKDRKGEILIEFLSDENNNFEFIVKDNGIGLSKDIQLENNKSMGLMLVKTLVNQLMGKINVERNGGTTFKISFSEIERKKN